MSTMLADLDAIEDKINEINELTELVQLASSSPRMRVTVTVANTTVEVEWDNAADANRDYLVTSPKGDDVYRIVALENVIRDLLQTADAEAREEIRRRERLDSASFDMPGETS